jgi:NACHT domain
MAAASTQVLVINMASISNETQPQPTPPSGAGGSPSLLLYFALLVVSTALILVAFRMQEERDWPGLLLNLASGLIGSVVILVVIDRRLRSQELAMLRRLPIRTTHKFAWLLLPTRRVGHRYVRGLLIALEPLIAGKTEIAGWAALEGKVRNGFALCAGAGEGKSTWAQLTAASLSRKYINYETEGRIPILFSLARWLPDRTLHQALYETFASYAPCKRWIFNRLLRAGNVVILLDGYDELWNRRLPFPDEIENLRKKFPNVALTLISRSDKPTPSDFGKCESLVAPTAPEMEAIRHRRGL